MGDFTKPNKISISWLMRGRPYSMWGNFLGYILLGIANRLVLGRVPLAIAFLS